MSKNKSPIFITGVYRSGTTLLSRALNNHSKITITYDSLHFMRFCYGQFSPISDKNNAMKMVDEIESRLRNRVREDISLEVARNYIELHDDLNYRDIYDVVMNTIFLKRGKELWGEKTQLAWNQVPGFLSMFPNGKAIIVVRDPRDIVLSMKHFTTEPGYRYLDAVFVSLSCFNFILRNKKLIENGRLLVIRYEDLVMDYIGNLHEICDWLRIDWDDGLVDLESYTDIRGEKWKRNSSHKNVSSEVSSDSIGRYKSNLSGAEIYFAQMILGGVIDDFEYVSDELEISSDEQANLDQILSDPFIVDRYNKWVTTKDGVDEYPSPPPRI